MIVLKVSPANALSAGQQIYVSPEGNDGNQGSQDKPVQTLSRARDLVRTINQTMTGDITVFLRGGMYRLPAPWSLEAVDSGMNGYRVIYKNYPGEKPILSGGEIVHGWVPASLGSPIWKTNIGPNRVIRQLYVNGEREIRARSNQPLPVFQKTSHGYIENSIENTPPISAWENISDVEFVSSVAWKQYRCRVQSVTASIIIMQQPCWDNSQYETATPMDTPSYIENAMELLDTPQEWYYNQTDGWLYYYPYRGQGMTTAEAIVPTLGSLLTGSGTSDDPIHDISFAGLTFEHAAWNGPSTGDGYASLQASLHLVGATSMLQKIPAAVTFRSAKNISVRANIFTHLGGAGLTLEEGSQQDTISGNHFTDISGSGIQIGDVDQPHVSDAQATSGNTIANNYVRDIGKEFQDAVGIWLGYVAGSAVQHNELFQLPYSGISIGWGWGNSDPTVAKNNQIENNYVHDHLLTLLDGGGIYSLAAQPGNVITGNVISRQKHLYGAIYLDAGSRGITVSHNAVFDNVQNLFVTGGENTITDNYWQNRYAEDIDIFLPPPWFGPNSVSNNHEIGGVQDIPSGLLTNAGLEESFSNIAKLPYPTNLQSACDSSRQHVQLSWNAADGAPEYSVALDDVAQDVGPTLTEMLLTSSQQTISPRTRYRWWVHVVGDDTHITSATFTCPGDTEPPTTPTHLQLLTQGQERLEFSWDASVDNDVLREYRIFRDGEQVSTSLQPIFADAGLTPNTSYEYVVQAVDVSGNTSERSAALRVSTLPLPPIVVDPPPAPPISSEIPAAPAPPEIVVPTPTPLIRIPQVQGAATYHPIINTLKLTKNVYTIRLKGKAITIRPFAPDYKGKVWAESVDFGPDGKLYVFLNSGPYKKGQIRVYRADGKLLQAYNPFGGDATRGLNATVIVASSDKVYLAVGTNKTSTTVKTYQVLADGLKALNSLTAIAKPGKILVHFQDVYKSGYGLVTMRKYYPRTLKIWKLDPRNNIFIEDTKINKARIKM
ncbi:MAG: right-handed parallel beta-helix repeat-containing protein [Candidatus Kerfeldbacteria bacterium]|nr:right-handed parallel beta-helix repeat-containing protein [Candidatus Kerfeldbacteria bacterium]